MIDKSSILWKDFITGIRRRKVLVKRLHDAALHSSTSLNIMRRQLMEVRHLTLQLIEDALEIEYRFQMFDPESGLVQSSGHKSKLPPMSSFRAMGEKEDVIALVDIISDVDDLLHIPNIRTMLPGNFPQERNPFLLGKSIDELADITPPHPEPGNTEEELKVLELLRYKRAARALLRAECQVQNNLPVGLHEMERLIGRMGEDENVERLLRATAVLLDNDRTELSKEPEMRCLTHPAFAIDGFDTLNRLNRFKGEHPMRVDVQVAVRQLMDQCSFGVEETTTTFLLEWVQLVLGAVGRSKYEDELSVGASTLHSNGLRSAQGQGQGLGQGAYAQSKRKHGMYELQQQPSSHFGFSTGAGTARVGVSGVKPGQYNDLTSVVSNSYLRGTHEDIYVEPEPLVKRISPPQSRPVSRGALTSSKAGNITEAILAGQRNAAISSRPASPGELVGIFSPLEDRELNPDGFQPNGLNYQGGPGPESQEVRFDQQHQVMARGAGASAVRGLHEQGAYGGAYGGGYGGQGGSGQGGQELSEAQRQSVREEVQRIVSQMGMGMGIGVRSGGSVTGVGRSKRRGEDEEDVELDRVSSLRYEVQRMQRELLRRQVLDPRHYQVLSVDAVAIAQAGLTVPISPGEGRRSQEALLQAQEPIQLAQKVVHSSCQGRVRHSTVVEALLDVEGEELLLRVKQVTEVDEVREEGREHREGEEAQALVRGGGVSGSAVSNSQVRSEETIASTRLSKLTYNRLCPDYVLGQLQSARRVQRLRMLQNVFDAVERLESPSGPFSLPIDRLLLGSRFQEDGMVVDLRIVRNDACDGVVINVTPLLGINNPGCPPVGPVTIFLPDRELQVLMVNQHGLYLLARSKWASLELVAQWLAGRLSIRKIRANPLGGELEGEGLEQGEVGGLDQPSFVSQISGSTKDGAKQLAWADDTPATGADAGATRGGAVAGAAIEGGTVSSAPPAPLIAFSGGEGGLRPSTSPVKRSQQAASPRPFTSPSKRRRGLLMMDMQLDRRVDLSEALLQQWRARNTPSITGMDVQLRATQDLEMLVLNTELRLPLPHRYRLLVKQSRQKDKELLDLGEYSDGDEDGEEYVSQPITLLHRLTSSELAVFGNAALVDKKKTTLSQNMRDGEQQHPDTQMWNVLSRLKVFFQGSKSAPFAVECNANDADNWKISFDRRLVREVKTVSKAVLVLSASAIGGELLMEAEPLDHSVHKHVGSKLLSEAELGDIVYSEGWPPSLLEYAERKTLALQLLDKLKIVGQGQGQEPRLELHTFPETRMLQVGQYLGPRETGELGSVEISYHSTLSDVRVLIKNELDVEDVPKQFRFMYQGAPCSVKQEPFRRAWECSTCLIAAKSVDFSEIGTETDDMQRRREGAPKVVEVSLLPKGQRRVLGKWAAVPVATLCQVLEGSQDVQLLHPLLRPGDVIRIGSVLGRDYLVLPIPAEEALLYPNSVKIGPAYDLAKEPDFSDPTQGNFPHPKKAGMFWDYRTEASHSVLKNATDWGFQYVTPPHPLGLPPNKMKENERPLVDLEEVSLDSTAGNRLSVSPTRKRREKRPLRDCWIWRCVPQREDSRPRWLREYHDGNVQYSYEHRNSALSLQHFRVSVDVSYLEVLCTDSRVGALCIHAQRTLDMEDVSVEHYGDLAFKAMCEWAPKQPPEHGVDRAKFIKLVRDVGAFPDLQRPGRVAQLDALFAKKVQGEFGMAQRYLTYAGFVQLLKEVAVLRFPPPKSKRKNEGDEKSMGSGMDDGSVGSLGSLEGSGGSVGSSVVNSVVSVRAEEGRAKGRASKSYSQRKSFKRVKPKEEIEESVEPSADLDPVYVLQAYAKFVAEYVMMYPGWYAVVWEEAKVKAMHREAPRYCAATRIAATWRGSHAKRRFRFFHRSHVLLQSFIRRKFTIRRVLNYVTELREDWCLRTRYHSALLIQALVRRFCKRCWYARALRKLMYAEIMVTKARRFRLKKLRHAAKKGVLYRELKRVNGIMVFVRLMRHDARSYSRDCGLVIEAYVPHTQATFRFNLEDFEVRFYLGIELDVEPTALSMGDCLDTRNLRKIVSSRLIVHRAHALTTIIFSKHALGQRGQNTYTAGKRVKGELFVAKIFETGGDVSVQMYHRHTCKIFTCNMRKQDMLDWMHQEHQQNTKDPLEKHKVPVFLREGNEKLYYMWILDHITIDTRKGFDVMFTIHLLHSRKKEMLLRIQCAWRRALVRPKIVRRLEEVYLKVRVSALDPKTYYLNRRTGTSSWAKTKLLGGMDLNTQPTRGWVSMTYHQDGMSKVHYVNPFTGKYTHLTPLQALAKMQALARRFLLWPIAMPRAHFLRAGKVLKAAQKQYQGHKRLAGVINWAMVQHVCNLEEGEAKKLFAEAVELSGANPLVTRAYAFFMLATAEAPIKLNRERVNVLLHDAAIKDPQLGKFEIAYWLYQLGCLRHPQDYRALVNLAVVQCILYGDNYNAEKLLRRALVIAPFEERVMEVWNLLKPRFPERQMLYSTKARVNKADLRDAKPRTVHGRPVKENSHWAGWCFVESDKFNISKKFKDEPYWYNPADGMELRQPPDFQEQWVVRKSRSRYEGELYGLHQYYDPVTADYFQYHSLTDSFS
ncbi:hypothetical protein B484DRAFT_447409 [Ochromonadaceae sp. CCMP2298]|nr:hypothetical protein B484DRAFT_447409 [Ochromonadaceae sp. CCMP2298]